MSGSESASSPAIATQQGLVSQQVVSKRGKFSDLRLRPAVDAVSNFAEFPADACSEGSPADRSTKLSIIVPCYNEAPTVVELLHQVRRALPQAQIIVIDDGSSDGSSELIRSLADELHLNIRLLSQNCGKGAAFRVGLALAERDYVVIQDADLEYDPQDIIRLLDRAIDGGFDAVYGSRYLEHGRRPDGAWWNYFAVKFLALALRVRHGLRLSDPATCYKLFRRDLLDGKSVHSNGFELCQEINRIGARGGWRLLELPIGYQPRTRRQGKKIRFSDFSSSLLELVRGFCFWSLIVASACSSLSGCGYVAPLPDGNGSASEARPSSQNENSTIVWNCGIVLPGEATTVIFPLVLSGVDAADDISQVNCSCECIEISVIDLAMSSGKETSVGARITIDRTEDLDPGQTSRLAVSVEFITKEGGVHNAIVRLVLA